MKESSRFIVLDHNEYRIGNDVLIIPVENGIANTGKTLFLNDISLVIWNGVKNNDSVKDISLSIQAEYDEQYNTILDDVIGFIQELLNSGFIAFYTE